MPTISSLFTYVQGLIHHLSHTSWIFHHISIFFLHNNECQLTTCNGSLLYHMSIWCRVFNFFDVFDVFANDFVCICAFVLGRVTCSFVDLTCVLCAPSEFELQIVYSMCVVCSCCIWVHSFHALAIVVIMFFSPLGGWVKRVSWDKLEYPNSLKWFSHFGSWNLAKSQIFETKMKIANDI